MTMRIIPGLLGLIMLTATGAQAADAPQGDQDDPSMMIEHRIEDARRQLDQAARKLAELHSEMWRMETTGSRAKEPMLGILLGDAGTDAGLTLAGVTPDSGAEQAGLKAGDVIVAVNQVRLDQGGEKKPLPRLAEAMSTVHAGDEVPVDYLRDGKPGHTKIVTRERGHYMAQMMKEKGPWLESLQGLGKLDDLEALKGLEELDLLEDGKLDLSGHVMRVPAGLKLEDVGGELGEYFEVDHGVLVLARPERADALRAGDVLTSIDGKRVTDADAALSALAGMTGRIPAEVKRHGQVRTVELDLDALNADQAVQVIHGDRRIRIHRRDEGEDASLEISVDD